MDDATLQAHSEARAKLMATQLMIRQQLMQPTTTAPPPPVVVTTEDKKPWDHTCIQSIEHSTLSLFSEWDKTPENSQLDGVTAMMSDVPHRRDPSPPSVTRQERTNNRRKHSYMGSTMPPTASSPGWNTSRASQPPASESSTPQTSRVTKVQSDAVVDRLFRWKADRARSTVAMQKARATQDSTECTFTPRINHTHLTATTTRGDATSRLYHDAQEKYRNREEAEKVRTRREKQECPFRPSTNTDSNVKSRFREDARKQTSETVECSFAPTVNEVATSMHAAQMYLEAPAHERLYQVVEGKKESHCSGQATPSGSDVRSPPSVRGGGYRSMCEKNKEDIRRIERLIQQSATTMQDSGSTHRIASPPRLQNLGDSLLDCNTSGSTANDSVTDDFNVFEVPESQRFGPTEDDNDNSQIFADHEGRLYTTSHGSLFQDPRGNVFTDMKTLMDTLTKAGCNAITDGQGNVFLDGDEPLAEVQTHGMTADQTAKAIMEFQINGGYVETNYLSSEDDEDEEEAEAGTVASTRSAASTARKSREGTVAEEGDEDNDDGGTRVGILNRKGEVIDFTEFLLRQNSCEESRRERLHQTRQEVSHKFTPRLCKRSLEIAGGSGTGKGDREDFLQRQVMHQKRVKKYVDAGKEIGKDCSFTPSINPKSRELPKKSAEELSVIEPQRAKARLEELRKKAEEELKEECTHHPRLNTGEAAVPAYDNIKSGMRLKGETHSYINRVKVKMATDAERVAAALSRREAEELEQCSFKPTIHAAPEYVKRIAQSMSVLRGDTSVVSTR